MSWSVSKKIGTAVAVRAAAEKEFAACAASYAGKPEGADVLAAMASVASVASVASWLDECAPDEGAQVEASGSRGASWLTIEVKCLKVQILR